MKRSSFTGLRVLSPEACGDGWVLYDRAHHDDNEERPRRLTVEPSMLGYTKGIRCCVASSRRDTMTFSRGKKKN